MANSWNCDRCGKQTYIAPPVKAVMDPLNDEQGQPILDSKGVQILVQRKTKVKQQDLLVTGKVEDIEVGMFEDLLPRTRIVYIRIGDETVQRDYCPECVKSVLAVIRPAWDLLEKEGQK